MKKMTKKEFMALHREKKIKLIVSMDKTKEETLSVIENARKTHDITKYLIPLSRIDLENQGEIYKTACYTHDRYVFVEETINNALNRDTSRNDIVMNTIAYYKI